MGPDVNESSVKFTVNTKGDIRFGMAAIKGVGEGAVNDILAARMKGGMFKDIYDFAERVNLQSVNKKNLEGLAQAGAFDSFGNISRSQFFAGESESDPVSFIEKLIRYGNKMQSDNTSLQQSLFGSSDHQQAVKKPAPAQVKEWPQLILLEKEKNLIGIYLTAHPLDDYRLEMENFCTKGVTLKDLNEEIERFKDREMTFGGMVTDAGEGISKNGKPFSKLTLSDYTDSYQFFFFTQDFVEFGKYCKTGLYILVRGKVQKRYNSEALEFRINHIELLSEVRKNQIRNFTINIPLPLVNQPVIHELEKMMKKHKGSTFLRFNVVDQETGHSVVLFSRNTKIMVSNEFFSFFEHHPEITFHIN
jgi:DNA polymerase-3 subunit alpha